ncbi:MAG TPA: Fe-S-cluster-containing hydrogenase [Kofleriaceae bacterium]|jgi:molybdopterin-containing oxidoreductase family iron-sulfur binding subunit
MSANEHDEHGHDHDHDSLDTAVLPLAPTPQHGFWRSLSEIKGDASHQKDPTLRTKEFPTEPSRIIDPLHRRNFFKLMGASMGLAGVGALAAGCRYEAEEIVPLARRPEGHVPGTTNQYATAFELGGIGYSLLATSWEGRPIKLDGNTEHPFASGGIVDKAQRHAGSSTFIQASILHLYDPDRSKSPLSGGKGASMEAFRAALPTLREKLGPETRILSEASSSPTLGDLRASLKDKGVQWHEYEPVSFDNEREGLKRLYGAPKRAIAKLDKAETIVTLDADIFNDHPAQLKYSRDWARSRRLHGSLGMGKMNRTWSVESQFSSTGAMADHRLSVRSELVRPFAMALEAAVGGAAAPSAAFLGEKKAKQFLEVLATELLQNRGRAVVVVGSKQPPEVHAIAARINAAIGAVGQTLDYIDLPDADRDSHVVSIQNLVKAINGKQVKNLIILGGNPVYDAPADLDFAAALASLETSVHLSEYANETSLKASWHVPRSHFLEAWGDTTTYDGTITLAQPLIAPLYESVSSIELLSMILGPAKNGQTLVSEAHESRHFGAVWRQSVHDGFVSGSTPVVNNQLAAQQYAPPQLEPSQLTDTKPRNGELEVTFAASPFSYDGRFANNAWLQETPDFMTKAVWDNYALVGPETADSLGLVNNTMATIKIADKSVTLPVYTMPGQARGSIALMLGGGRTAAGRVGGENGVRSVGWNVHTVRTSAGFDFATKASVTSTGEHYEIATTQEHWDIRIDLVNNITQDGIAARIPELIKITTKQDVEAREKAGHPYTAEPENEFFVDPDLRGNNDRANKGGHSLFKEKDYNGHRWGMAIDLTTCTGCNSCMVACQAENNIPVVGRQEVINNREMSWIRIDRYFSGSPDDPQVVHQPIGCQQCEQAPCEAVCPVGATSHSDEGLNDMAYNRCIGTRYCANNCPYKVRRFNFLDWNKEFREGRNKVRRLLFNPEVTVRMRGVMEKCTYCVQRIQNAKINAKAQVRQGVRTGTTTSPLPDGEITTACQDACPTEAIVFGDLEDKNSRVSKLHDDNRAYDLLPDNYTKPRTRFLSRLRNPHPKMVSAADAKGRQEEGH